MRLVTSPDDRLRKPTKKVTKFDTKLRDTANQMVKLMVDERGIGIAAQQCGLDISIMVCQNPGPRHNYVMCNPSIEHTEGYQKGLEGCLSFEGTFLEIERPNKVTVKYKTITGLVKTLKAEGLFARCILHEYEHLQGILLSDSTDKKFGPSKIKM